jgi:large conductance mechanosensitive channel
MLKEFKDFAMKGNLIDIAVGLAMGAAFGKVTDLFVNGMFMPLLGKLFQLGDLSQWKIKLEDAVMGADGKETTPEVAIQYGNFIGSVINFLIVALVMFMIVKAVNKMKEPAPPPPPAGPTQEELLAQIRDLLKK